MIVKNIWKSKNYFWNSEINNFLLDFGFDICTATNPKKQIYLALKKAVDNNISLTKELAKQLKRG